MVGGRFPNGQKITLMIRQGFLIHLKPDALAEYIRLHDAVPTDWPLLAEALRASGVMNQVIFEADPYVFVYAEVTRIDAYQRLRGAAIHQRWMKLMTPLMQALPDGEPDIQFMSAVSGISFDNAEGMTANPERHQEHE